MSRRNQKYARAAAYKKQWGPTKSDEEFEALGELLDEGFNPKNKRQADIAVNERVKAKRAERGPMAYDQARGELIPSPRARAQANAMTQEKWDAQEEARIAQAAEDKKRQGVSAEDYWERNPTSNNYAEVKDWRDSFAVQDAALSGDTAAIEAATRQERDAARSGKTSSTNPVKYRRDDVQIARFPTDEAEYMAEERQRLRLEQEEGRKAQAERRAEVVKNYRNNMVEKRKENERASRDRFDDFVIAQDQRKTDKVKAEAYLQNFNRQARAMRRVATGNSSASPESAQGFWERNADLQATARNLNRMSQEERLKWADSQVKEEEKARAAEVDLASRPSAVTEEELAEFFDRPVTLTDFIKTFFGGGRK